MNVLIDTCIVIDAIENRIDTYTNSQKILLYAADKKINGYLTAKSITDIYYIVKKYYHDNDKTKKVLEVLCSIFYIIDTKGIDIETALCSKSKDYEDAVMIETAKRSGMDFIITRNIKDYNESKTLIYTPEAFIKLMEELNKK